MSGSTVALPIPTTVNTLPVTSMVRICPAPSKLRSWVEPEPVVSARAGPEKATTRIAASRPMADTCAGRADLVGPMKSRDHAWHRYLP